MGTFPRSVVDGNMHIQFFLYQFFSYCKFSTLPLNQSATNLAIWISHVEYVVFLSLFKPF